MSNVFNISNVLIYFAIVYDSVCRLCYIIRFCAVCHDTILYDSAYNVII